LIDRILKILLSCCYLVFWLACRRIKAIFVGNLLHPHIILYYHGISRQYRERFARQMDDVLHYAVPVAVDSETDKISKRTVSVTFDDGFANLIDNALPALQQRQISATVFIPSGYINRKQEWPLNNGFHDDPQMIMSAEQIKQNLHGLFTIGSHTVSHCSLTQVPEAQAKEEITDSRKQLEALSGKRVESISFPYGHYDETIVKIAQAAGYRQIFSIDPKNAADHDQVKGRFVAYPTDWRWEFRLKLLGGYQWLNWYIVMKKKMGLLYTHRAKDKQLAID
jgi:peptidoglycan/xylan/chitin deacetylase (PgdA/CDA1 family)